MNWEFIGKYLPMYEKAALLTVKIGVIGILFAILLGLVCAAIQYYKVPVLRWIVAVYVELSRNTPLLVQLCIVHFGLPQLTGMTLTTMQSGVLTFSLNSAAYISEIFRGGINAIDRGQYEAAMSLGVGYRDMMKDIILPQAVKHILPSLVNEAISLLKESSILSYIGAVELLRAADQITVLTFRFFEPYLVIALIYYVFVMLLSMVASRVERWVNRSDRVS